MYSVPCELLFEDITVHYLDSTLGHYCLFIFNPFFFFFASEYVEFMV